MSAAAPLLRAPPFPWVKPDRAAISMPAARHAAVDADRLDRLVAAIRAARVGGAFWAGPGDSADRTDPARRHRVDPWSLLAPGQRIAAGDDGAWALLALLAGAEVADADPAPCARAWGRRCSRRPIAILIPAHRSSPRRRWRSLPAGAA